MVLELAATIEFLRLAGCAPERIDDEVMVLKPLKATEARLEAAHQLLKELGVES